jgi:rubrerythrin
VANRDKLESHAKGGLKAVSKKLSKQEAANRIATLVREMSDAKNRYEAARKQLSDMLGYKLALDLDMAMEVDFVLCGECDGCFADDEIDIDGACPRCSKDCHPD